MRRWFYPSLVAILLLLISFAVIFPMVGDWRQDRRRAALQAEYEQWFVVSSITVSDTIEGVMPVVFVDRKINHPFTAEWIVTVRKVSDDEEWEFHCHRTGKNDYRRRARLPQNTDLNWWLGIPPNEKCDPLTPGFYIVTVLWRVETPNGIHQVRAESNPFRVQEVNYP